jgi:hypothetical protein
MSFTLADEHLLRTALYKVITFNVTRVECYLRNVGSLVLVAVNCNAYGKEVLHLGRTRAQIQMCVA